ncbi:hypothetical protein HN512_04035 [Candidatus Peregrinibacteria bacterium]|nr:hypothetical protein [Candidatus Peregrinibacteria bacterium]MBT3598979.1 hypothetical protein [Candidatus Peregrinibacteria bacterium]MBT4585495.1 hypothetical protein [Candidatus Peregrinibacteria bacterium]MBT6731310.1 hypothetical protein [Candidatus Peregrinibacteria bacterium]MBT7009725.1 hypothetical protein [Candidatus Peregrinibacteria bacterium]
MCCKLTAKAAYGLCLRVTFGVSLLLVGLIFYSSFTGFKAMAMGDMGFLEPLGFVCAYIIPALMIVGGALIAIGLFMEVGALLAGIALGSMSIGLLVKPLLSTTELLAAVRPVIMEIFLWMIVGYFAVRVSSCFSKEKCADGKCSK